MISTIDFQKEMNMNVRLFGCDVQLIGYFKIIRYQRQFAISGDFNCFGKFSWFEWNGVRDLRESIRGERPCFCQGRDRHGSGVPGSLNASNFGTLVSLDVWSKISPKLFDPPAHLCGVAFNLRDVEYETRCFQSFKVHCLRDYSGFRLTGSNTTFKHATDLECAGRIPTCRDVDGAWDPRTSYVLVEFDPKRCRRYALPAHSKFLSPAPIFSKKIQSAVAERPHQGGEGKGREISYSVL